MTQDDRVKYEVKAGVAHMNLNRPEALNALDLETIVRLGEVVRG